MGIYAIKNIQNAFLNVFVYVKIWGQVLPVWYLCYEWKQSVAAVFVYTQLWASCIFVLVIIGFVGVAVFVYVKIRFMGVLGF